MAGSGSAHLRGEQRTLLSASSLVVRYPDTRGGTIEAVSNISLDLLPGETVGIVGESGCGKSSVAKALLQLPPPAEGRVTLDGVELTKLSPRAMRTYRPKLQIIFQNPVSSMNPRRKVVDIVAEGIDVWRTAHGDRLSQVKSVLELVGLSSTAIGERRPNGLSGGQAQRVAIARSLLLKPRVLVCDEVVSALDVSAQAQVLNLLKKTAAEEDLSTLFISHDLAVVKYVSGRIMVMYLGKLCEVASASELYQRPAHPYTSLLLESIPGVRQQTVPIVPAEMPSPKSPPSGCRFRTRCPFATELCAVEEPVMREIGEGHYVACHHPLWSQDRGSGSSQEARIDEKTADSQRGTGNHLGISPSSSLRDVEL